MVCMYCVVELKDKVKGMSLREFLILKTSIERKRRSGKPGRLGSLFSHKEAEKIKEKYGLKDEEIEALVNSEIRWV